MFFNKFAFSGNFPSKEGGGGGGGSRPPLLLQIFIKFSGIIILSFSDFFCLISRSKVSLGWLVVLGLTTL